jgi:hypothetical protein
MTARKTTATPTSNKKSSSSPRAANKTKQVPSPKGRMAKAVKPAATEENPGEKEVTIDRRRGPGREEGAVKTAPAKMERRAKVQRRRQIDPTTCERDYSDDEVLFMNAMDEYKRTSGRMFPTCSEVLEVIRGLGYVRLSPAEIAIVRPEGLNPVEQNDFTAHESEDEEDEFEFDDN